MRLAGEVQQGQLTVDPARLSSFEGKKVLIEIEHWKDTRTLRANARYFGVLVPLARQHLSKMRDIPYSKDQTHFILAGAFAGIEVSPLGVPVPKDTHTMSTREFYEFCERVTAWLGDNAIPIPDWPPVEAA